MRHWSVRFQKLWNFRVKHRRYRLECVLITVVRGGNLSFKSLNLVVKWMIQGGGGS